MEQRYRALRLFGTIYRVLGAIAGVITVLLVLAICASSVLGGAALNSLGGEFGNSPGVGGLLSGVLGGVILSLIAILYGGAISITLYALGEGVFLLLALEENTRATSLALRSQLDEK